mgnify:CR=1 FL=1
MACECSSAGSIVQRQQQQQHIAQQPWRDATSNQLFTELDWAQRRSPPFRRTPSLTPPPSLHAPQVGDRCGECEDDHIDLLQDRPLSFAPFNPQVEHDNYNAPYVNAKDGLRGFSDPKYMRGGAMTLENAGAWTADWQWVPCDWSHSKCANLMKNMGYKTVWTPKKTEGVDSFSMRPISQLRGNNNDRLFKEPWS